jgi:hypothetical protein
MKTKTDYKKSCHKLQAEQIIKNMKKRGVDSVFCETSAQAVQEICRITPGRITVVLVGETLGY